MSRKTLISGGIALLTAILISSFVAVGGVSAGETAKGSFEIDHPDEQTAEWDLNFSGAADTTIEIYSDDGSVLKSQTVNGTSGQTETVSMDLDGLDQQSVDWSLMTATSGGESNVSLQDSRMNISMQDEVTIRASDGSSSETVTTDVRLSGLSGTVSVELVNSSGAVVGEETISFDSSDDMVTSEITVDRPESGETTLTTNVSVTPLNAYESSYSGSGDGFLAAFGIEGVGANTRILVGLFAAVVVGLAAWKKDLIPDLDQ